MTDEEVIVALGDTAAVSARLDLARSTVANWKERGIPWRFRPVFKEMARRKRISLPTDFIGEQARRIKPTEQPA